MSTAWMERAACAGQDTELWFSSESGPGDSAAEIAALRVCAVCPVREDCLTFGLAADGPIPFGIFGGLKPNERLKLRHGREVGPCGHWYDAKNQRACSECLRKAREARDAQVLALAGQGMSRLQISAHVGIAHRTVSDILARYAEDVLAIRATG